MGPQMPHAARAAYSLPLVRANASLTLMRSEVSEAILERETGIEPATNSLEGCDSTTELLPPWSSLDRRGPLAPRLAPCAPLALRRSFRSRRAAHRHAHLFQSLVKTLPLPSRAPPWVRLSSEAASAA